jgi:hypothetical protein
MTLAQVAIDYDGTTEASTITEYSSAQLISFAQRGMLDKLHMAALLPDETRGAFLAACAGMERAFTRACESEVCLNALVNANPAYNKACGELWLPLFRSSKRVRCTHG